MEQLKYLLLVAFLSATVNLAYAGGSSDGTPWCDCHVTVTAVQPDGTTGGGKVYACNQVKDQTTANCKSANATFTILGKSHNKDIFPASVYLAAKPDDGWEFDYWECTKCYGSYKSSTYKGTAVGEYKNLTAIASVQKACVSKMNGDPNNGEDDDVVSSSGDINAIWIAHFKRAEMQTVIARSENESLGTANIDKVTNYVDDEVTLSAWCGNSNNNPRSESIMFLGWYRLNETTGEKEFVSRDNPYTFTITEANKGTYYARYASGYTFWRVRNNQFNNYLSSVAHYTGTVSFAHAQEGLETQMSFDSDMNSAMTDAGTMMKIWVFDHQPRTGKEVWDIYVQDEHTNQYYDEDDIDSGTFLQVTHQSNNTYIFNGNNNSFYLYEKNNKITGGVTLLESAYWQLEGMDKDLTTKENYFAVDPSEFIGPDSEGYYWTTLRVCFNMKYETSEITPYIVTAADASTGTMELSEVTGGIIPEKTCVLLKCNSTDVTRNVMIPTTTAASFSPTGNLLQSSTYYYKNQSVSNSLNLKGIKLVDGRIGFGGSTKTSVDGNRAYLSIANDVAVIPPYISITLANLCRNGQINGKYAIEEPLYVAFAKGNSIWVKDNNLSIVKDTPQTGDLNYEIVVADNPHEQQADYDQSNWLEVQLASGSEAVQNLWGTTIKANKIAGKFTNKINPTMTDVKIVEGDYEVTQGIAYAPNYYCTANFDGSQNGKLGNGSAHYFLTKPKPQEWAQIVWAMYNAANSTMVIPSEGNGHDFTGSFSVDLSLNTGATPQNGQVYNFEAIVRKAESAKSTEYKVYPLNIPSQPTAVADVKAKQVAGVKYYNLAGIESGQPFDGVNIVVTTYTDGSRSSSKVLR